MRNKKRDRRIFSAPIKTRYSLIVLGVIFALLVAACGPDKETGFQGYLTDASGNPINGTRNVTFRLFADTQYCASGSSPDPTKAVFAETHNNTQITNGLMNVQLGSNSTASTGLDGIDPSVFAQPLYLEIRVGGETLKPCQKLMGAPYAMTLAGGAVIGDIHEGNGPGGSDSTGPDYGTLSVVATGAQGTALMVGVVGNGDLIRACGNAIGGRACPDLRFRVTYDGQVTADGAFTGGGADFAEMVKSAAPESGMEPGDVLAISSEVDRGAVLANQPNSTAVMGVYSSKPGFIGSPTGAEEFDGVPVAIVGIVPVKVTSEGGMIHRGDLLTSSSMPGYAMKSTQFVPGSILGKAMGELNSGVGVIDVLLMLR